MATVGKDMKPSKPLPLPNSDFYQLAETLPPEELATLRQVRSFMENKVAPIINKYWVEDSFPFELLPAFKELNLGGLGLQGYGCRGGSKSLTGLIAMEMARTDPSIETFFRSPEWPSHGLDLCHRIRRTETEVAAADGLLRKNRMLRLNRTAGRLRSGRWSNDDREKGG